MTDKEKADLQDKIGQTIKSFIEKDGFADRNKLKDLFKDNLNILTYLLVDLTNGQIINDNGQRYTAGLKFKSFSTYRQFINDINNPKPTVIVKTHWYDWAFRVATLFGIISTFFFSYNAYVDGTTIRGLTDINNQQQSTIDSLAKESLYRDSLLNEERKKSQFSLPDSLQQNESVKK